MYLSERLTRRGLVPGRFVDLGSGTGQVSSVLLDHNWQGVGIDLNEGACARNCTTNARFISRGSYEVRHGDFLTMRDLGTADLVISSMVLEHLDEEATGKFFDLSRSLLSPTGSLILMVPGSPDHWGVEDEIAGHVRRFDRQSLVDDLHRHRFQADHVAGLTYPLSNLLLPISNFIVGRAERTRIGLSKHDRTVLAGDRQVMFKTSYPAPFHWVLNSITMYPFHVLQKRFRDHPKALVLNVEARLA